MQAPEVLLIIGACASPLLAMWNTYQGIKIKELELKYDNLCKNCIYDFTPKPDYVKMLEERDEI